MMKELTEADMANIEKMGGVGFSYKEVALALSIPESEVREEFENHEGRIYQAWMKGRLQTELDLRLTILREAKNGSSPMLGKLQNILQTTDEEHEKLIY